MKKPDFLAKLSQLSSLGSFSEIYIFGMGILKKLGFIRAAKLFLSKTQDSHKVRFDLTGKHSFVMSEWEKLRSNSKSLENSPPHQRAGSIIFSAEPSPVAKWFEANFKTIKSFSPDVIVISEGSHLGGSERFIQAVAKAIGVEKKILIIRTSPNKTRSDLAGGKILEFSIAEHENHLDAQHTIFSGLAKSLNIGVFIVGNSLPGWRFLELENLKYYAGTKFYATLFCQDKVLGTVDIGYGKRFFGKVASKLDGIITDNYSYVFSLVSTLSDQSRPALKIHRFDIPSRFRPRLIDTSRKDDDNTNAVVWIGRFSAQKNPIRLFLIALMAPRLKFHMFGSGPIYLKRILSFMRPKNVMLHGEFSTIEELDKLGRLIYLNTSSWDGLPNVLIEILASGRSAVSTPIPGIKEFKARFPEARLEVVSSFRASALVDALVEVADGRFDEREMSPRLVDFFEGTSLRKQVIDLFSDETLN